jgi:hypothetical protein
MWSDGNRFRSVERVREPLIFFENKHDEPHKSPQFHQGPSSRHCFETDAVRYFPLKPQFPQRRTGLGHGAGRNLADQTSHWFHNKISVLTATLYYWNVHVMF